MHDSIESVMRTKRSLEKIKETPFRQLPVVKKSLIELQKKMERVILYAICIKDLKYSMFVLAWNTLKGILLYGLMQLHVVYSAD